MRILIAPDTFAGTLTAPEAAAAIAAGWRSADPDAVLDLAPISDGGPGFLDVLSTSLVGEAASELIACSVHGPRGEPRPAGVLVRGATGYLESAQACGLHLLTETERDPTVTTTYGVGELITAALDAGVRRIVVGLGGSSTNDGGAGLLAALGAEPRDRLAAGGGTLARVTAVALSGLDPRLADVDLIAATDVDSPLLGPHGATAVFGPQKGAGPAGLVALEAALGHWATVLGAALPAARTAVDLPGAGAAGGLGYALLALGGRRVSGIELVVAETGLRERIAAADLVVTGEGSFDGQSLRGKATGGIASAARAAGVACLVLAGRVGVDPGDAAALGVTAAYAVADHAGSVAAALARPADELAGLAARVAHGWSSPGGYATMERMGPRNDPQAPVVARGALRPEPGASA